MNGDSGLTRGQGREIHVSDLAAVVVRHWRVVILLALVVAVGAYFQPRRSVPQFHSPLTIQIPSPKQRSTGGFPNISTGMDETALRTAPVLSEALVLTTQDLALRVVRAQGLRLDLLDPRTYRGDVMGDVTVDSTA